MISYFGWEFIELFRTPRYRFFNDNWNLFSSSRVHGVNLKTFHQVKPQQLKQCREINWAICRGWKSEQKFERRKNRNVLLGIRLRCCANLPKIPLFSNVRKFLQACEMVYVIFSYSKLFWWREPSLKKTIHGLGNKNICFMNLIRRR